MNTRRQEPSNKPWVALRRRLIGALLMLAGTAAQVQAAQDHAGHHPAEQPAPPGNDPNNSPASGPRDPQGYSDGLTRGSGPYAVPGVPPLMLSDEHRVAALQAETLERRLTHKGDDATAYNLQAWYGTTYNKAVLKTEGAVAKGRLEDSRTELLWGHAATAYWDTQLGVRVDNGDGPSRQRLAFGVQGLAPYWFELEATGYLGSGGRTALRIEGNYELLLSQRLILEPRAELQAYGKDDPGRRTGSGLAEAVVGLRLRYELNRQFAPYVGVERAGRFGHTADYARAEGDHPGQTRWVVGVRLWL